MSNNFYPILSYIWGLFWTPLPFLKPIWKPISQQFWYQIAGFSCFGIDLKVTGILRFAIGLRPVPKRLFLLCVWSDSSLTRSWGFKYSLWRYLLHSLCTNAVATCNCCKTFFKNLLLKFIYSEKATNVCKISTVDLSYVVTVKSTVDILQNLCPSQNIWTLLFYRKRSKRTMIYPKVRIFWEGHKSNVKF